MADVDKVIDVLRRRQLEFTDADLMGQRGKTEYDYGVACGTYQAYKLMLADIEGMLEEEDQAEKRLEANK
jgi:hypothetical protein